MKGELRILVCGDRKWTDKDLIHDVLYPFAYDHDVILIEGGANGADLLARQVANELGCEAEEHRADWKLGKAAGPIRNQKMLDRKPHLVFAFHKNIAKSKGTKDMVNRARRAGIPTCIFPQKRFA